MSHRQLIRNCPKSCKKKNLYKITLFYFPTNLQAFIGIFFKNNKSSNRYFIQYLNISNSASKNFYLFCWTWFMDIRSLETLAHTHHDEKVNTLICDALRVITLSSKWSSCYKEVVVLTFGELSLVFLSLSFISFTTKKTKPMILVISCS